MITVSELFDEMPEGCFVFYLGLNLISGLFMFEGQQMRTLGWWWSELFFSCTLVLLILPELLKARLLNCQNVVGVNLKLPLLFIFMVILVKSHCTCEFILVSSLFLLAFFDNVHPKFPVHVPRHIRFCIVWFLGCITFQTLWWLLTFRSLVHQKTYFCSIQCSKDELMMLSYYQVSPSEIISRGWFWSLVHQKTCCCWILWWDRIFWTFRIILCSCAESSSCHCS